MKNLKNKFVFGWQRKDAQKVSKKLSNQDKFHIRILSICQLIAEKDQKGIALIMKSQCIERFTINEKNNQVIYEIILIQDRKEKKNLA